MGATVITYGPFFENKMSEIVIAFLDEAAKMVADHAVDMVTSRLDQVLQNPTGHYRSLIVSEQGAPGWRITDSNCIYGPWLEGVGSRNAPVTSFPGYGTFRQVGEEVAGIVERTVTPVLVKYVDEING